MLGKHRIISLAEAASLSTQLAERLRVYQADCVVSIEEGGWFVGDKISCYLQVPHMQIRIGRVSDEEVRTIDHLFPRPFRLFATAYRSVLRLTRTPQLIGGLTDTTLVAGKRVLLIDDAIHTGESIRVAKEYLFGLWANVVQVAALSAVRGFQPMYLCMLQRHYCYPWSCISP